MNDKINRLETIRKKLNLSKFNFSEKIGIRATNYSNIINGRTPLKMSHIYQLVNLGFNPLWVMNGEGDCKVANVSTYSIPENISIVNEPSVGVITEPWLIEGVMKEINMPLFRGEFSYALLTSICRQYMRSHSGDDPKSVSFAALSAAFLASLQAWDLLIDSLLRSGQGKVEFELLGKPYTFSL